MSGIFFCLWWTSVNCALAWLCMDFAGAGLRRRAPVWLALCAALTVLSCLRRPTGMFAAFVLLWLAVAGVGTRARRGGIFASAAVIFTLYTFLEGFSALAMSWAARTLPSREAGAAFQVFVSLAGLALFALGLRFAQTHWLDALYNPAASWPYLLLPACALALAGVRLGLSLDGAFERRLSELSGRGTAFALCLMLLALAAFFASAEGFARLCRADASGAERAERARQMEGQYISLRHDLNNHLLVLSGLLSEENYAAARRYAGGIRGGTGLGETTWTTGSAAVDALLRAKLGYARSAGISVECTARVPPDFGISEPELCVLFGNLLDNAISACERERGPERKITLASRAKQGLWLLEVVNTCTDKRKIRPGTGLGNVRSVARRYCGAVEARKRDGVFRAGVLLCAKEK